MLTNKEFRSAVEEVAKRYKEKVKKEQKKVGKKYV